MTVLRSFAELAAVVGVKIAERERKQYGSSVTVSGKCGSKAARIYTLFQDREAGKTYGKDGEIILTPEVISQETGMPLGVVIGCLIGLARNGFIRPTPTGGAKAA